MSRCPEPWILGARASVEAFAWRDSASSTVTGQPASRSRPACGGAGRAERAARRGTAKRRREGDERHPKSKPCPPRSRLSSELLKDAVRDHAVDVRLLQRTGGAARGNWRRGLESAQAAGGAPRVPGCGSRPQPRLERSAQCSSRHTCRARHSSTQLICCARITLYLHAHRERTAQRSRASAPAAHAPPAAAGRCPRPPPPAPRAAPSPPQSPCGPRCRWRGWR